MYTAQIENSGGESLRLTQNEEQFQVVGIAGLNPVPAHVNLTDVAGLDGGVFNSSKLNTRDIVITLKINGDAEENRQRRQKARRSWHRPPSTKTRRLWPKPTARSRSFGSPI